jgi:hypothetical protein
MPPGFSFVISTSAVMIGILADNNLHRVLCQGEKEFP